MTTTKVTIEIRVHEGNHGSAPDLVMLWDTTEFEEGWWRYTLGDEVAPGDIYVQVPPPPPKKLLVAASRIRERRGLPVGLLGEADDG